ncbi:MAG TPA: glycine cleavage system aminomethyltransferase GcvT [Candidatus Micrarchaeia archaeon]|nr:glycine cleavage system aminomethyltransferase GcvT [Candidatus Micrarchaeia archaeon]
MLQHTPLEGEHLRLGATLVAFGGFAMPLQYGSIRQEHAAVRERAGLFDVSHMGEVSVTGPGALAYVQRLVANDVERLRPGAACYTMMCRPDGGIVDDLLVYRDDDGCFLVVNAGRHDADLAWMREQLPPAGVELWDRSPATALLALQGPRAAEILAPLTDGTDPLALRTYHHREAAVAGVPVRLSRTGYTGEDGFECYCDADRAVELWRRLIDAGAPSGLEPAGLGARDTLRLEAGLRLYGQDMDETLDPFTCGLGWTVKLGKGAFIGREALARLATRPRRQDAVGLRLGPRHIPRHGQQVLAAGRPVGEVTSGGFGFTVGGGIALALVEPEHATIGSACAVDLRGSPAEAQVVALPFYRRPPA